MKKYTVVIMFITFTIMISGCFNNSEDTEGEDNLIEDVNDESNDEETKNDEENEERVQEETEIEIEPLPDTFEELVQLDVGRPNEFRYQRGVSLSQRQEEIYEILKDELPVLDENSTDIDRDQFYSQLFRIIKFDFQGPEHIIKELKFQSLGEPDVDDPRYQFKENLNVIILLDASGSMASEVNGKIKMDAAKSAIKKFLSELPEETNVALRVYGHEGSSAERDRGLSCESSELVYSFDHYESSRFDEAMSRVHPAGWTPIGLALQEAQHDLSQFNGENNTNIIYLVSDGIETCDTDPIGSAEALYQSDILPIINVIGFDVDGEGQNHLKEIANSVNGIYQTVVDESELTEELQKVNEIAEAWEEWKGKGESTLRSENRRMENIIWGYGVRQEGTSYDQQLVISNVLHALRIKGHINRESFEYLEDKNKSYHGWIRSEISEIEAELNGLLEKSYSEAIQELEEKYERNVSE